MTTSFHDHFSGHAGVYQQFRPAWSADVAAYCAGLAPDRMRAWDVATGNGQLATKLGALFDEVIATDASAPQIASAAPHARVQYRVESAERSTLDTASVSLITVAQAAHWLDGARFADEVRRVARPGAAIVYLAYDLYTDTTRPELDEVLRWFYRDVVGPYWPPERSHFDDAYARVPFPFSRVEPPRLVVTADWTRDELLGYVRSWSSVQRYTKTNGADPTQQLLPRLLPLWPDAKERHHLEWNLIVRAGHVG